MNDTATPDPADLPVWDAVVRIGHWLLVVSIALAWLSRHGWGIWHEIVGYLALAIVGVRLVWGRLGSRHARFSDFVRGPRATLHYARRMLRRAEPNYTGHNPLGGWMVVALMTLVVLVGATGWLYTTDRFWGIEWVEDLHNALANLLFALVALHIAGVLYASFRHRENLIAAMVHGRKRRRQMSAACAEPDQRAPPG